MPIIMHRMFLMFSISILELLFCPGYSAPNKEIQMVRHQ